MSVNENCDPTCRTDHLAAIPRLQKGSGGVQSLLFRKSITLPQRSGRFCFGKLLFLATQFQTFPSPYFILFLACAHT